MKVWDGDRAGSGGSGLAQGVRARHRGVGAGPGGRGLRALCGLSWGLGAEGTRVVSDSRISLQGKQIVPGKDALCQSHSQITKQLYRVQIDILIFFNKIVIFSEDKVFSFK